MLPQRATCRRRRAPRCRHAADDSVERVNGRICCATSAQGSHAAEPGAGPASTGVVAVSNSKGRLLATWPIVTKRTHIGRISMGPQSIDYHFMSSLPPSRSRRTLFPH